MVEFLRDPVGSLGAAITFPFFNYNELSLQKESSLIERDQAKLDFVNGFITAVQEVSDALNELSYQEQLQLSTQDEYQLTAANLRRYEERYRYGSASLTDVLDASDALRSAQNKLLSSKRDLLNASMMLMIALGGDSFTSPTPTPATSTQPQNDPANAATATVQQPAQQVSASSGVGASSSALAPDAEPQATPVEPAAATADAQSVYDPMVILEQAKERAHSSVLVEA